MRRGTKVTVLALALGLTSADAAGQLLDGPPGPASSPALGAALDEVEQAENERARLEAEIEGLVARRNGARQRLRQRVRTFYRLRRAGALPLAGGFEALLSHQARLDRLERLVQRDVDGLGQIDRRVVALREEVREVSSRLENSRRQAERARHHEQAQMEQMQILSGMIEDPEAWSGPNTGGFGIRFSDGTPMPGGLRSERGSLPLPVSGSVQLRDAEREGGAGLDVIAEQGARVRAVAHGRVAYAAAHPGYGRLVIVEHDGDYYTVYGGLGQIATQPGAQLQRESLLGTVGAQALFFQVRRGTRPLSAREWLGI